MKKEYAKDLFLILLFAAVFAACMFGIQALGGVPRFARLEILHFVVIALATFRLTHLFTRDKILEFARFTECVWCAGMWSALVIVTIFVLGVWGQFITYVLAIAGIAAILQEISSALTRIGERR